MPENSTGPGHEQNGEFGAADLQEVGSGFAREVPAEHEGEDADGNDRFPRSEDKDVPTASLADRIRERGGR